MEELRLNKNLWGLLIEPTRLLTTTLETLRPKTVDGSKTTRPLRPSKMVKRRVLKARSQCSTTMRRNLKEASTTRDLKEITMTLRTTASTISKLPIWTSLLHPKTRASIWFLPNKSHCQPTTRIQILTLLTRGRSWHQNLWRVTKLNKTSLLKWKISGPLKTNVKTIKEPPWFRTLNFLISMTCLSQRRRKTPLIPTMTSVFINSRPQTW